MQIKVFKVILSFFVLFLFLISIEQVIFAESTLEDKNMAIFQELLNEKKYDEAMNKIKTILEEKPDTKLEHYYTFIMLEGSKLDADSVNKFEEKVANDPNDFFSRVFLLSYYMQKGLLEPDFKSVKHKHIFWTIENKPDYDGSIISALLGLHPSIDGQDVYLLAKNMWISHVENNKKDTTILNNAADFFLIYDRDFSEKYFNECKLLEPENSYWAERLGHLLSLPSMKQDFSVESMESAQKALNEFQEALKDTVNEEKFYLLDNLAKSAFNAGNFEEAKQYANDLLLESVKYENDWNYGNAIHHGNIVLGKIAFEKGDIEAATQYLIQAGKTPGSPQLDSFGPDLTLAEKILKEGGNDFVIEYLNLIKKFWNGNEKVLEKWESQIRDGESPNFTEHMYQ